MEQVSIVIFITTLAMLMILCTIAYTQSKEIKKLKSRLSEKHEEVSELRMDNLVLRSDLKVGQKVFVVRDGREGVVNQVVSTKGFGGYSIDYSVIFSSSGDLTHIERGFSRKALMTEGEYKNYINIVNSLHLSLNHYIGQSSYSTEEIQNIVHAYIKNKVGTMNAKVKVFQDNVDKNQIHIEFYNPDTEKQISPIEALMGGKI